MRGVLTGVVVVLSLLAGAGLRGADPAGGKLSPGDRIEVEWAGQPCQGEFVSYSPSGWLKVKFSFMGVEITPTLPPEKVRVLGGTGGGGGGGAASKRPLRTWTDATGKFKQKARFVKLDGDELTLETEAGKTITMTLAKLSEADQAMARKIAAKAGAAAADDGNPFGGDSSPGDPPGDGGAVPVAAGDWSRCRRITLEPPAAWSVPFDGLAPPKKLASKLIPLPETSAGADAFFEKIESMPLAADAAKACVVIRNAPPARPSQTSLVFVDLVTGKAQAPVAMPPRTKVVDVDRTGEFVLTVADTTVVPGELGPIPPALGVWRVAGGSVKPVRVWNPQDPGNVHTVAPTVAEFIDADHVLCLAFPNKLSVWNVPEARAIHSLDVAHGTEPVVSPGGKYLAAAVGDAIGVFDALTGQTVGSLPVPPGAAGKLSFRPDGGQLAMLSARRLVVWDLQAGAIYRDIAFSTPLAAGSVDWLYGGYVLCGGTSLVDLERRVVIWKYLPDATGAAPGGWGEFGGQFWYALQAAGAQRRTLVTVSLPHEDVARVSAGLDPEQLLAVRPGTALSLDIRVQGDAAEQQKVQQGLTARLEAAGLTVAPGAALVLQATTETGESREMSYRAFGRPRGEAEKVTVTDQISRLKILEQGKPIWEEVVTGGSPMFLEIKQGQSLQEALAPYQKPNLDCFSRVDLPSFVARSPEAGAYGFSVLTARGVVNTPPPGR